MAENLDMVNRDPIGLNSYIQVTFADVLAEPEGAHSGECLWRNSYKCFTGALSCCYMVLTYICGLPISLCWGCCFACISFEEVWCCTPSIRAYSIFSTNHKRHLRICCSAYCVPCCETCGMCFSRISVTNSTGEPPRPLGKMDHKTHTKSMK